VHAKPQRPKEKDLSALARGIQERIVPENEIVKIGVDGIFRIVNGLEE